MGEICVNLYTLQELISQDLGLQWSLELQSSLRSRSSQWTLTCQNSVRRKTIVRIISFIVFIYLILKRKVLGGYLPLFLSKVVQFCFVAKKVEQAQLAGNLIANILMDTKSNQEFLNH